MPVFTINTPLEGVEMMSSRTTEGIQQYIQQSMQNFYHSVGEANQQIIDSVKSYYQDFKSSFVGRALDAVQNKMASIWGDGSIQYVWAVGEIQQAPDLMVPYVMACPEIRTLYHQQRIEGYGDRYIDTEPQAIGKDHYHYRRVTDGMWQFDKGVGYVTHYTERLHSNDFALTTVEKIMVLTAWDIARESLESGSDTDPTSEWNACIR